jgi:hypothetical protein
MDAKSVHEHREDSNAPSQNWDRTATKVDITVAYVGLLVADIILRFAGFSLFHRAVRRCPTRSLKSLDRAVVRSVCSAVDAAALYYLKEVLCLQRSAVVACLLRMRGLPAQLVIGCRKAPFLAHAWVEVNGDVVDGEEPTEGKFYVLERC